MTIIHSRRVQEVSNRTGPPSHRHAAPSAPWPWIDIQDDGECLIFNCVFLFHLRIYAKKLIVRSWRPRNFLSLLNVTIEAVMTVGESIHNRCFPIGLLLKSRKAKLAKPSTIIHAMSIALFTMLMWTTMDSLEMLANIMQRSQL